MMSDRIIISFDKSQEDVPVLTVFRENQFTFTGVPPVTMLNIITGDHAVELYEELTRKAKKE